MYKGELWGQIVAAKTVKPHSEKIYLKALLSEIKVLIHLGKHDNIVRLEILEGWILGAFTSYLNSGVIYLFLEYCEAGNLLNYLRANKSTTMSQNG